MEPISISIGIIEVDAKMAYFQTLAYMGEHEPERDKSEDEQTLKALEGKVFYRARVVLNDKTMQIESPVGNQDQREELLRSSFGRAWEAISSQAFPPSEMPLVYAG